MDAAELVLGRAGEIINADRFEEYGHPAVNFNRIAGMWDAYLVEKLGSTEVESSVTTDLTGQVLHSASNEERHHITAADVAAMMALVKISRTATSPRHLDTWIDLAGYAALGAEVSR